MKRYQLYILSLIIFICYLTSCSPVFYLKENLTIDTLKLNIEFGSKITPDQIKIINNNVNQFLSEFNEEQHDFKIITSSLVNADISLKFESISVPSNFYSYFFSFFGFAVANILPFINPPIVYFVIPFSQLNKLYSSSNCSYIVSNAIANFPNKSEKVSLARERGYKSKKIELQQHLRSIDFQLGVFFDSFEKEYKKKKNMKF